jgi:cystathionine beta-lyase
MPDRDPSTTALIHHDYKPPEGFESVQPGVHKASTVIFKNTTALRNRRWQEKTGYTYGLHGTPTTFTLEERIASLEGGTRTLLAPSGLAAITLVSFSLLKSGDEVALPDNVYGPNKVFAREELAQFGVGHRLYDPLDPQSLRAACNERTRLVWVEAAGSVTMEFPDLPRLAQIARECGAIVALDNTWGAGIAFAPFETSIDISVHALTKYPSGGGDVLMGAITTRDTALHERLAGTHMRLGYGVGANDAEAILRGLPSLALRYAAHDASARSIALWLRQQPQVVQLLHPAFEGSPGHAHWKALCTQAAGLFSVVFDPRYSPGQVDAFVDALRLFRIGYSWGGPVSLVVPYRVESIRSMTGVAEGTLVRFSVGLEAAGDLIADLQQALAALER